MCYQFEIVHQSLVWCFRRVKFLHVVGTDPEFSCWLQDKNGEQKEEGKTRRAPPHGWICEGIKHTMSLMQSTVSKTHSSHWRGISYRNQHVECLHNALSLEIWYNSENKRFQWQSTILQVRPARSHESPQKAKTTEQGLTVTVVSLQINNHTSCLHMQKHRSNLQPSHKDGAAATPLTAQPHCPQSPFLSIFLHKFCQTRRIIVSCSQPLAHISVNVTQIDNLYMKWLHF